MMFRLLFSCCLALLLASSSSFVYAEPTASSIASGAHGQQSFKQQLYSRTPLAVVAGGESAKFRDVLYSVNPFDSSESDYNYYIKVVDSLVRIRTILENEEVARKSKISADNNATGLDRQLTVLSVRVENERAAALFDKVELTKRQMVFLANQLKDDLASALVYPYSSRSATSGPPSSPASRALKRAFTTKIDALCTQVAKDCLALDSQYQVRLGSIVSSAEGLKKQMTSAVGSNKVSDSGTNMYVRNYVNFGGVDQSPSNLKVPVMAPPDALLAVPGKLNFGKQPNLKKSDSGRARPLP